DFLIPDQWAKRWLDEGHVFGFVGGTDSHGLLWQHGVCAKRSPWDAGLTGLIGAERNRASVLEALRTRRCFATTGVPIELSVTLDGHVMGSQTRLERGTLEIGVRATALISDVIVVQRDSETPLSVEGTTWSGAEDVESGEPGDFVYVRVVQRDGEMAWSSPIWFTH